MSTRPVALTPLAQAERQGSTLVTKEKFMFTCAVCGQSYQHGPHRYEGHQLKLYGGIFCCDSCWEGNWDGWGPIAEPAILAHLERLGLPAPTRNANGWLPRD